MSLILLYFLPLERKSTVNDKKHTRFCSRMLNALARLLCAVCPSLSSAWRRCRALAGPTRPHTSASPPPLQTPPLPPLSRRPSPSAPARSSPTADSHRPRPPWIGAPARRARRWAGSRRCRRRYHSCSPPLSAQQLCRRRHRRRLQRRSMKTEPSRHQSRRKESQVGSAAPVEFCSWILLRFHHLTVDDDDVNGK